MSSAPAGTAASAAANAATSGNCMKFDPITARPANRRAGCDDTPPARPVAAGTRAAGEIATPSLKSRSDRRFVRARHAVAAILPRIAG
jgi:hypothetical protein